MEEISPEAYGDVAVILHDAATSLVPMSVVELHLFSYLGCIVALTRGQAVHDWGYKYALTKEGFPFSAQLEEARHAIVAGGFASANSDGLFFPTQPALHTEVEILLQVGMTDERRRWLRSATACALALPVGAIRYALNNSPGIASPLKLGQRKQLLEQDDIDALYDEFGVINSVLGESAKDALSPAVIWLSSRVLAWEDKA